MTIYNSIQQPVLQELEACRNLFSRSLQHTNPLLSTTLDMLKSHNGKMMRPLLTLLSAKLTGQSNDNTIRVATAYEAFHTASLIHDDVVDESEERRGGSSVNHAQGNKVAVLVGDYVLAVTLNLLADTHEPTLVNILSEAAKRLSDGELLQLHSIPGDIITENTYLDIIRNKTAALFAACAESGAITVDATESDQTNMQRLGELVGICFQIKDDILDYMGTDIGKPTGNDMREGKLTLPAIYVIHQSDDKIHDLACRVKQGSATDQQIETLVAHTLNNGGIDYAESIMNCYADEARTLVLGYPDTMVRTALLAYIDYVVARNL